MSCCIEDEVENGREMTADSRCYAFFQQLATKAGKSYLSITSDTSLRACAVAYQNGDP